MDIDIRALELLPAEAGPAALYADLLVDLYQADLHPHGDHRGLTYEGGVFVGGNKHDD